MNNGAGAGASLAVDMATIYGLSLLYLLPTIITYLRKRAVWKVLILNLFFGWTILLWFLALALACSSHHTKAPQPPKGNLNDIENSIW